MHAKLNNRLSRVATVFVAVVGYFRQAEEKEKAAEGPQCAGQECTAARKHQTGECATYVRWCGLLNTTHKNTSAQSNSNRLGPEVSGGTLTRAPPTHLMHACGTLDVTAPADVMKGTPRNVATPSAMT